MDVREKLEVIAHLGEHIIYREGIGICYDSAIAKVIEDAHMTLKNGVTVQEWISVKDRLPDSSVKYIVVADSKYHTGMRVVSAKSLMVEEFWGMPMGHFAHGQQVTHWMPLPEPPKGE